MPIRLFNQHDKAAIVSIYNQAIETGFSTADRRSVTVESRALWFQEHELTTYPLIVELGSHDAPDTIRGWCSLSPYRKGRQALQHTVEISYYVHRNYQRQGVATAMVEAMFERAKILGYRTIFAVVLDTNHPSIRLLEKLGFATWGHLPNVADFDGVECGHLYLGKRIQ